MQMKRRLLLLKLFLVVIFIFTIHTWTSTTEKILIITKTNLLSFDKWENNNHDNNNITSTTTKTEINYQYDDVVGEELATTSTSTTKSLPVIPNVLLAGAQKSATTSIADYLALQKDYVCQPIPQKPRLRYMIKEPHFFDKDDVYQRGGIKYYKHIYQFCNTNNNSHRRNNKTYPILLDATPKYIKYAKRIYEFYNKYDNPHTIKIILILREPVSREISWYQHQRRLYTMNKIVAGGNNKNNIKDVASDTKSIIGTFENYTIRKIIPEIYNITNEGLYYIWIQQWLQYFNRKKQILILSYDNLRYNETDIIIRIHQFLNIPIVNNNNSNNNSKLILPRSNTEHVPLEPIPCSIQEQLASLYEPYNQALYKLLNDNNKKGNYGPPMEPHSFTKFTFQCQ